MSSPVDRLAIFRNLGHEMSLGVSVCAAMWSIEHPEYGTLIGFNPAIDAIETRPVRTPEATQLAANFLREYGLRVKLAETGAERLEWNANLPRESEELNNWTTEGYFIVFDTLAENPFGAHWLIEQDSGHLGQFASFPEAVYAAEIHRLKGLK